MYKRQRKISSVSNSYNAGTVINPAGMAGGITGYIGSDASVYNCYNMGKVTGGAISGDDYSESTLRSGEEELPSIIDCYYLEGALRHACQGTFGFRFRDHHQ